MRFDDTIDLDMRAISLASSATIPGAFKLVEIDGMYLADGGTYENLSIQDSIDRCRDEGVDDQDIIVDVLMAFGHTVELPTWTSQQTKFSNAY